MVEKYARMVENISDALTSFSKDIEKIMNKVTLFSSSKEFRKFVDFITSIPDDAKNTLFYADIQKIIETEIFHYEDVESMIDTFGYITLEEAEESIKKHAIMDNEIHHYINGIIIEPNICKMEKTVLLLAHMEPLIYDVLKCKNYSRGAGIKGKVKYSVEENIKNISSLDIGKLYIEAITQIVFANTDKYNGDIDTKLPFRNHILHNGIIGYTDSDIEAMYEMLIKFIAIIILTGNVVLQENI